MYPAYRSLSHVLYKTALPLTRTATWLNKLEGNIEYLKEVVVHDSLGIAATLENEMEDLVSNYECEWQRVITDPEMRKKFSHFVNVDEQDPSITFVDFRSQKIPTEW